MWPGRSLSEQGVEVFPRLSVGALQVAALAFLLDEQDARPEEVDVAVGVVETPHVFFEARDGAAPDAEDLEEFVVETLRLALFRKPRPPTRGRSSPRGRASRSRKGARPASVGAAP